MHKGNSTVNSAYRRRRLADTVQRAIDRTIVRAVRRYPAPQPTTPEAAGILRMCFTNPA